jgi:DnaJ-class molecular chaperone
MWVEFKCPGCKGEGYILGIAGTDPAGEYFEGRFDCYRCNGDGTEPAWMDSCSGCGGRGELEYGQVCPRCVGRGYVKPAPPPAGDRFEIIE